MDSNKRKVMAELEACFDLEQVSLIDFPLLPGGTIVRDRTGAMLLFYHDILTGRIKTMTQDDKTKESIFQQGTGASLPDAAPAIR